MEQREKFSQITADFFELFESAYQPRDSAQWVSSPFASISGGVVTHDGINGQKCVLLRTPFTPLESYFNVRLERASSAGIAIGVTSSRKNDKKGPPLLERETDSVLFFTDRGEIQAEGSLVPLADVAGHHVVKPGTLVTLTLDCAERRLGFAVNGCNVRVGGDYMRLNFRNLRPVVILYAPGDIVELFDTK